MYNAITRSQIFVLDQYEALDFHKDTLGLELADDLDLGLMRWLTVRAPGEPDREILLKPVGAPATDGATAEIAGDLLTKGAMGGWLSITTDEAQAAYDTLVERGVDVNDELAEKPYGIDSGIRDPFGNQIRFGQLFGREED